ncbi:MAG: 6-phosphofructokinase [Puniceicoccales bacterium]|jgi:6-phosphofructokinase 1|nr:6-phosphofructokinase [Puniceicoccales bacterium]
MAQEFIGNLLVAQSGGPTPVINASLAGVITEALQYEDNIAEIYGGLNGIQGILNEQLIDLAAESQQTVRALSQTPGAILGTCRYKMKRQQDFDRVLDVFAAHNIRYFLYIGGNDSQDTAAKINALALERGYALRVIGVPKTVDNDLPVTDHCPGYGSVIKHIATTVREMALDNAAMGQHDFVSILEVMGRGAGWIAAGSVLAKRRTALIEDAPHIVLLPEAHFNQQAFVDAVQMVLRKQHFCFIVTAEGLLDPAGNFLGAGATATDAFGHAVLGGVGETLRTIVEQNLAGVKVRSAKLGITQRAAIHNASQTDVDEAVLVGRAAVRAAIDGESGKMVVLVREDKDGKDTYSVRTELAPLNEVANAVKTFPTAWIGEDKMSIGFQFAKYAQPLIQGEVAIPCEGGLPKFAQLLAARIERKLDAYETLK